MLYKKEEKDESSVYSVAGLESTPQSRNTV